MREYTRRILQLWLQFPTVGYSFAGLLADQNQV